MNYAKKQLATACPALQPNKFMLISEFEGGQEARLCD